MPEQGSSHSKQNGSSTDQGQVTGQLSQGQGWLETEGILKGKLQRAAHARAAEAVGLHWPANRDRTATALLACWYGQGFSLEQTEGPVGRSLPRDNPL